MPEGRFEAWNGVPIAQLHIEAPAVVPWIWNSSADASDDDSRDGYDEALEQVSVRGRLLSLPIPPRTAAAWIAAVYSTPHLIFSGLNATKPGIRL